MKILLDECLPLDFRHSFPEHVVHTVEWADMKGKANGELLRAAETAGYEILLTVDQGIPHQHNLAERKLAIVIVRARTNQMEDLLPLVSAILEAIAVIRTGQVVKVP